MIRGNLGSVGPEHSISMIHGNLGSVAPEHSISMVRGGLLFFTRGASLQFAIASSYSGTIKSPSLRASYRQLRLRDGAAPASESASASGAARRVRRRYAGPRESVSSPLRK